MPKVDSLGDRMKFYENFTTGLRLLPMIPIMARLDGVAFHTFTKGLKRPYDKRLSDLMVETTRHLVKLTNARVGYTQSDEISLVYLADEFDDMTWFDGKLFKMQSVLAAQASMFFNKWLHTIPEKANEQPVFDCRVWNVPNKEEAANAFLWREQDATRNSVSMAAQSLYSQTELHGKSSSEMQEMMFQKGQNWNNYPNFFKRGTYVQRQVVKTKFTTEELDKLPEKHAARQNPDLEVERTVINALNLCPLNRICNRVEMLFDGESPKVNAESLEGSTMQEFL